MALQNSGPISISNIKSELGSTSNSLRALSATAGFSTPDAMSEFYGYSSFDPAWVDIHAYSPEAGASISGQGVASNPWVLGINTNYYGASPYGGDYWAGQIQFKVYPTYLGPINFHIMLADHDPALFTGADPSLIQFSRGGTSIQRPVIGGDAGYIFMESYQYPYPVGTEFITQYGSNPNSNVNYFVVSFEDQFSGGSPVVPRWTWYVWFTPG